MSDFFRNSYQDKPNSMYFIVVVLKYCFESRFSNPTRFKHRLELFVSQMRYHCILLGAKLNPLGILKIKIKIVLELCSKSAFNSAF